MSEWRPEQYDPAAHQQRVNQQQIPPSNSDPTRAFEQPQWQPWPPSQSHGQPPYPPQSPYGPQQPAVPGRPGGKRHRKRNILLSVLGGLLIFFIGVGVGAAGNTEATGTTSPTATSSPTYSLLPVKTATALPTAKKKTSKKKTPKKTHSAAPSTKAPAPSKPVQTTQAPAPATSAPPAPPTTKAAVSCYPLTNGGNCYEPGEYCRNSDHGMSGVAGDGEAIICEYKDGWRWEPA